MSWTSVKFANAVTRIFDLDAAGKTRVHRTVRNMVAKGVLPSTQDPNDGRGALIFDDNAAAMAILLLPMADMDMTVRGLKDAARYMSDRTAKTLHDPVPAETRIPPSRIEEAIRATKNDVHVELVTQLTWNAGTAETKRITWFDIEGKGLQGPAAEIIASYKTVYIKVLAELRLPASDLLKAFFQERDP